MTGGAGDDIYVFDAGDVASGESIVEGASDGTDDVIQEVDTTTDFSAMAASSFDEIEQIDINANSITGTFTAAQLTGETIGLHTVAAGTATNVIINLTYGETATLSGITGGTLGLEERTQLLSVLVVMRLLLVLVLMIQLTVLLVMTQLRLVKVLIVLLVETVMIRSLN